MQTTTNKTNSRQANPKQHKHKIMKPKNNNQHNHQNQTKNKTIKHVIKIAIHQSNQTTQNPQRL